jgi:hypothetical protein
MTKGDVKSLKRHARWLSNRKKRKKFIATDVTPKP